MSALGVGQDVVLARSLQRRRRARSATNGTSETHDHLNQGENFNSNGKRSNEEQLYGTWEEASPLGTMRKRGHREPRTDWTPKAGIKKWLGGM